MKKIKYIIWGIGDAILKDLKASYDAMIKPKQVMNILFWLFIIQLFTGKYKFAKFTIVLYFIAYIWKIIKQGDWKHRMRDSYLKQ